MSRPFTSSLILTLVLLLAGAPLQAAELPDQPQVRQFVEQMASRHHFDPTRLSKLLGEAKFQQNIIDAITRPAEAKPWSQYRPIFLTRDRIEGGVRFWQRNAAVLARAERVYGVAPEVIVAIIGVETRYGRHAGHYRVLDALATLAFGYPPRGAFFRRELEQYLLLTREEKLDPLAVTGSYAGAMGGPQFISSSYRAYAIDFDHDGRRDLWQSNADIIGSVANYFHRHGWEHGAPVASRAELRDGAKVQALLARGLQPSESVAALEKLGIEPRQTLPQEAKAALIELAGAKGPEYWLGLNNFYVITRYNHSPLYAMAVYQLSREIRSEYSQQQTAGNTP